MWTTYHYKHVHVCIYILVHSDLPHSQLLVYTQDKTKLNVILETYLLCRFSTKQYLALYTLLSSIIILESYMYNAMAIIPKYMQWKVLGKNFCYNYLYSNST